jgi:pullulanase/glycogen debranching enzyme
VVYQRKFRQGTCRLSNFFFRGALRLRIAGTHYEYPSSLVAKRRYLSNLSEEFPGHHRQRHRRFARRDLRLDYLKSLGVDAIWLTPFYVSPQVDNGYDVANYTAIDPAYGTLDDFDELVAEAKARGIRIVLDMVLNHTSTSTPGSASR